MCKIKFKNRKIRCYLVCKRLWILTKAVCKKWPTGDNQVVLELFDIFLIFLRKNYTLFLQITIKIYILYLREIRI